MPTPTSSPLQALLQPNNRARPADPQALGQEQFFSLLIAQLRNQDPTQPQDGAAFLGQLAQFGTVNGIQELETAVQSLSASLSSNQALQAATMIGRDVMVPSEEAWLEDQGSVAGRIALPSATSQLMVRVTDEAGATVRTISLGNQAAGNVRFAWDGLNTRGEAVPSGRYRIEAEALIDGQVTALPTLVAGHVESVALGGINGATVLTLTGLGQFSMNDVFEIG